MLLTDTIKNSISAIKKHRATIESKQHAETYSATPEDFSSGFFFSSA